MAMIRANHGGLGRIAQNTAPTVMAANAARTTLAAPGLRPLNSRAIATIGPNSPTAPNAITTDPNRPSSRPESRRIGSTAPSAVLVSAVPITRLFATSAPLRSRATPSPATNERIQAPPARRRVEPRTSANRISYPARKISMERPRSDRVSMTWSWWAQPSTSGPTRMPSTISKMTTGTESHRPVA
ncbi:hypothetical protein Smic_37470 [Streptomyces microflavus]|uniref:Uncharacterized protein n=1 Tax=Streptomyces microflavus TaxID=1919 RepID=A0A7J0CRR4_STRMI|nr:hypothetical protein Smic_37470 [Streptomyces microflavus]